MGSFRKEKNREIFLL